jgi:hypothetical protein
MTLLPSFHVGLPTSFAARFCCAHASRSASIHVHGIGCPTTPPLFIRRLASFLSIFACSLPASFAAPCLPIPLLNDGLSSSARRLRPLSSRLLSSLQPDATFAGHSLGEFSALASVADILPNSYLVDVMFYRGLTMQCAVEHDEQSRSNYAMCAINSSHVSKTFDDAALREVIDTISNLQCRSPLTISHVGMQLLIYSLGLTICLCGQACRTAGSHECPQRAVKLDEQSRSNYTMCVVNPSHVSKTFDDAALCEIVDTISNVGGCLLEIVNFNVEVH